MRRTRSVSSKWAARWTRCVRRAISCIGIRPTRHRRADAELRFLDRAPRVLSFAGLMTTRTASMPLAKGLAVWRGADQHAAEWILSLDAEDCAELTRSAEALRGRRLDSIQRRDFA